MQMDDRKMRVLTAVIEVYTHTGEPVGSKLVSEQMDVSSATVRTHIRHIYEKLDVHSRAELIELLESL